MSFIYPLFLIAGLTLAIPVLIHLFNLRRYKTVYFPHTRFLKNIQLNSRRQSQVRYKWLLALRLLFLTALILAFAQPFFTNNKQAGAVNRLQVIYVDNSASMSVKKGARSLLELAKAAARTQIIKANPGTRFVLLTNDNNNYQPLPADRALAELSVLDISANSKTAAQTFTTVQNLLQTESVTGADIYYYSDFQRNSFAATQDKANTKNIHFYGIPVQADDAQNIFIDTAYLGTPVLQTGQGNQVIVRTKAIGKLPKDAPVLQLSINGQVKSAATLNFNDKNESVDTLGFQVNDASWQRISLSLNDASVRFDDSFRITARSAPNLSVLVLNEGQINPYIQAAFRAYNGFRLDQADISTPKESKDYNLIILNGITHIDNTLGKTMSDALQQGQTLCIFPGKTNNIDGFNEGLKQIGDITVAGIDTAVQTVSSLQQGSGLVKDLFEHIPENVQLPVANWHYILKAGLASNEQSILSFRNGDPFLAHYIPSKGHLYICATAADLQSGNFPGSYFFVPFLYQMAIQSRGGDVYALMTGKQQAAYLPLANAGERNMVHIYGPSMDVIPPQRPAGAGLEVFLDQAVSQPGFYELSATGSDTTVVALNQDRAESALDVWNINTLKNQWKGDDISWFDIGNAGAVNNTSALDGFPLWKVCVILALLMLAGETFMLAGKFRTQTAATQ